LKTPIILIGAGKMGGALLKGWLARGIKPITVVAPRPSDAIKALARKKAITLVAAPSQATANKSSVCVIAIKPQILKGEMDALAGFAKSGALMLSVAAGATSKGMAKSWGAKTRIIRAMPNTPAAIGHGISGLYASATATPKDRKLAETLLSAVGQIVWFDKEKDMDSVTVVSGSGPAFVFLLVEAMTEAGVAVGLSRTVSAKLSRATVAGAGALLDADPSDPAVLRQNVTSPMGVTAAALKILMAKDGVTNLMVRAVAAGRKRAIELS
jgi:pyrroline-5-carboxylate reductase